MNKQFVKLKFLNHKQLHQSKRSEASHSDEYATPKPTFKSLCLEYGIKPKLDVCATKNNRKCAKYFNKIQNGLKKPWKVDFFCNPPNSLTQKFIRKACYEWGINNVNGIMIIPANSTVTKAGKLFLWNKRNPRMYPLLPTPRFFYNGKETPETARNRYVTVVFRERKKK